MLRSQLDLCGRNSFSEKFDRSFHATYPIDKFFIIDDTHEAPETSSQLQRYFMH